ncbi:hypothetical protein [Flavobacterium oreochromis]|uniref:YhhN-like protein n=1 Tax=Flavobacterium oreochromis TaxID=2906078 RepID=A0ABW8PAZ2_9FLAO|nr:hypothetical protein [Flavobacterium oreochromis]OWP78351.1 hypothetical protein BWG23_02450 [Flavobacterium oreochromis]QYS86152.1 hypothetical protein JJC03_14395 [Flavobacterium oreochromis]
MLKNAPLYVYLLACFLSVIAMLLGNEFLLIISKPVIIPALMARYLAVEEKQNILYVSLIFIIYFFTDALTLFNFEFIRFFNMSLDLFPYLLILFLVVKEAKRIGFNQKAFNFSLIGTLSLMVLTYFLLNGLAFEDMKYSIAIVVYGTVLTFLISICAYNYLVINNLRFNNILIAILFSAMADIVYVVMVKMDHTIVFKCIKFIFRVISYFFIVEYFINARPYFFREIRRNEL